MIGGKAIIVVGGTGMGKTTFVKKCLSLVPRDNIVLYDVNNEYPEFVKPDYKLPRFEKFCMDVTTTRNCVVVYEEATIFLDNRGSNEELREQLVRKRHTQNTYFLIFHSMRAVPKYLLNLSNMIVLHKTNDPLKLVEAFDNEDLTNAFIKIKNEAMLKSESGKLYSPSVIVNLL